MAEPRLVRYVKDWARYDGAGDVSGAMLALLFLWFLVGRYGDWLDPLTAGVSLLLVANACFRVGQMVTHLVRACRARKDEGARDGP